MFQISCFLTFQLKQNLVSKIEKLTLTQGNILEIFSHKQNYFLLILNFHSAFEKHGERFLRLIDNGEARTVESTILYCASHYFLVRGGLQKHCDKVAFFF